MHHKDKKRITTWLKDLRQKQYIEWIYDKDDFINKTKPAVYYLNLNSIRYLKTLDEYPASELRKRYKESLRKPDFITKCITIADCCIALEASVTDTVDFSWVVEADYINPSSDYYFLNELRPGLCFTKRTSTEKKNYLVEVFDVTTPRYMVKKRLKDYIDYLDGDEWQDATGDDLPPIVLIVLPTTAELIYAKRRAGRLLEDSGQDEDLHVRFATAEQLGLHGVTGIIWEEV